MIDNSLLGLRRGWLLPTAIASVISASLAASVAMADPVPVPGQKAAQQSEAAAAASASASAGAPDPGALPATTATHAQTFPARPWEMEPIDVSVTGVKPTLREEERIGSYGQPRWTAKRRFPQTRIYVVPEGKMEFEYWFRYTAPFERNPVDREIRTQWEFEMGLGHRLQLDLYLVGQQEGVKEFAITREKIELRYALADWGKIWGNPALYLEYQHKNDDPDTLEGKILLGGELLPRWHAGFNLVWERELWGNEADEYQATFGVSYTALDERVHVGVEGYVELVDDKADYWNFKEQLYLFGPSIMLSPVLPANILITPLFGAAVEDGKAKGVFQLFAISGWTF